MRDTISIVRKVYNSLTQFINTIISGYVMMLITIGFNFSLHKLSLCNMS